jgi:hypothetical protein
MTTASSAPADRLFARRLTPDAPDLASALGEAPAPVTAERSDSSWFTGVSTSAASKPRGIRQVLANLLHPAASTPAPRAPGATVSIPYGCFLVEEYAGTVTVVRDPGRHQGRKGATLYVIADLVGLPFARVEGQVAATPVSAGGRPGSHGDGTYLVDLWLDPGTGKPPAKGKAGEVPDHAAMTPEERIGTFLRVFMRDRDALTIGELVVAAEREMQPLIRALLDEPLPPGAWNNDAPLPDGFSQLQQALMNFNIHLGKALGLDAAVRFRPGRRYFRHQTTLNRKTQELSNNFATSAWSAFETDDSGNRYWKCPSCRNANDVSHRNCGECGIARPSAVKDENLSASKRLLSADGHEIELELEFLSYETPDVDLDTIVGRAVQVLTPLLRQRQLSDLEDIQISQQIAAQLGQKLSGGDLGLIGEFAILDFRDAAAEWRLQYRAGLASELRGVEEDQADLEVRDARSSLRAMQLLRERKELDQDRESNDLDLQRKRQWVSSELDQEQVETDAERQRLIRERQTNRLAEQLDREDLTGSKQFERAEELADTAHVIGREELERQAELRRAAEGAELEDRLERLRTTRGLDGRSQEQELELVRMRREQELEIEKARVASELELAKLQAMGQLDQAQREQQRQMSAAQLLATQASSLAQSGAFDALTQLAGHDGAAAAASAEARAEKVKAEMLEKMLLMQASSSEAANARQMELMMLALRTQQDGDARVQGAQQQSINNAVAWNATSIDAMAKVATAAASNPGQAAAPAAPPAQPQAAVCGACGTPATGPSKFCPECGGRLQ